MWTDKTWKHKFSSITSGSELHQRVQRKTVRVIELSELVSILVWGPGLFILYAQLQFTLFLSPIAIQRIPEQHSFPKLLHFLWAKKPKLSCYFRPRGKVTVNFTVLGKYNWSFKNYTDILPQIRAQIQRKHGSLVTTEQLNSQLKKTVWQIWNKLRNGTVTPVTSTSEESC